MINNLFVTVHYSIYRYEELYLGGIFEGCINPITGNINNHDARQKCMKELNDADPLKGLWYRTRPDQPYLWTENIATGAGYIKYIYIH